ncbi:unnamed protein product [Closterium sp. NIES-65]|nr:unnamed protein product [Closterium sp. NIES-65]
MDEVKDESKQVSYHVIRDSNGNVKLECPAIGKQFAAEEISAQVLRKLVDDAAKFLNDKVTKAVVTVPAYFNDSQRTATKDAGRIAGIDVLRIINEPTAASLAYGFDKKSNETILVFDLGGGTFDVSVLEVGDGVFEVLSTSGDTHLGGDDFDKRIVDWLADAFKRDEGVDLTKDKQALQRLTEAAEKAKMELSTLTQTSISLPFITATADGPKHIDTNLTRAKFEELCSDLLDRCKTPVENALRDAKLSYSDLQEVILVGGSTRIPAVQELVKKLTGKDPNVSVNPDEVVALGAAVQAGVLAGEVSDIVLLDVTPAVSRPGDARRSDDQDYPQEHDSPHVEIRVQASDKGTGKKQDITITGASTLPKDEVSKMVEEAEKYAAEDKEKREAVDVKNQADSMIYQTEKQLKELAEKVPADVKAGVEAKVADLKAVAGGDNIQAIKDKMNDLNQEVMKLGQAVYSQGGAPGADGAAPSAGAGPTPGGAAGGNPNDVIDADFTDSNECSK